MGWVAVAASAVSAINSISQGEAQKEEANKNALLLQGKANQIEFEKGIQYAQDTRAIEQFEGTTVANIAASGVMMKGSPMSVFLDSMTQMNIDRAIGQFNLEQQKRYTLAEADAEKRRGKAAARSGYMQGLSTMLSGTYEFGKYKGWINTK